VQQNLSIVFTVEPEEFFVNPDTTDNHFQDRSVHAEMPSMAMKISALALQEHKQLRKQLSDSGIVVAAIKGPHGHPDAIFPNNSFSLHERNGKPLVILYPMSIGRRQELPKEFIEFLKTISGNQFYDLRHFEQQGKFLEGTGVLNFSADEKSVFMGRSERANEEVLSEVTKILDISDEDTFVFDMFDDQGRKIYHTNVISWVGKDIFAICLESIPDGHEKENLVKRIAASGMTLLDLSFFEVNQFAGNALELVNHQGQSYLSISETGYNGLSQKNRDIVNHYYEGRVISIDAKTIQQYGGGSVRCMEAKGSFSGPVLNSISGILKSSFGYLLLDDTPNATEVPRTVAVSGELTREANYK
jgi:hypothetical protein